MVPVRVLKWLCCGVVLTCCVVVLCLRVVLWCVYQEAERYRSEYNKLRYSYTLLKAQAEHQQQDSARTLEERSMHFEAQVCVCVCVCV